MTLIVLPRVSGLGVGSLALACPLVSPEKISESKGLLLLCTFLLRRALFLQILGLFFLVCLVCRASVLVSVLALV